MDGDGAVRVCLYTLVGMEQKCAFIFVFPISSKTLGHVRNVGFFKDFAGIL